MAGGHAYRLPDEVNECRSCGSRRITHLHAIPSPIRRKEVQRLVFVSGCRACGLVFVNPSKSATELFAYYGEDGGWNARVPERVERAAQLNATPPRKEISDADEGQGILQAATVHARRRFGAIEGLPALDFGCGFGHFLELLAACGFRPVGLDPATRHLITQFPMVDEMPAQPTYAVILAKHVLEHLPDPLAVLRQFRRAILPGGVLALGMPCLDGLPQHHQLKYCINEAQHVSAFTRRSLSALLATAGFEAVAFYQDEGRPHRMRCVAVAVDRPRRVWWPLRDARMAFLGYRRAMGEPLWSLARPVRYWMFEENQRVARKAIAKLEKRRAVKETLARS
jgi:SAM-dependent methyltransferase